MYTKIKRKVDHVAEKTTKQLKIFEKLISTHGDSDIMDQTWSNIEKLEKELELLMVKDIVKTKNSTKRIKLKCIE